MNYYRTKADAKRVDKIAKELKVTMRTVRRWLKKPKTKGALFMVATYKSRFSVKPIYRLCTTGRAYDKLRLEYRKWKRGRG